MLSTINSIPSIFSSLTSFFNLKNSKTSFNTVSLSLSHICFTQIIFSFLSKPVSNFNSNGYDDFKVKKKEVELSYLNVVGQDDLTGFEVKKKKKKPFKKFKGKEKKDA